MRENTYPLSGNDGEFPKNDSTQSTLRVILVLDTFTQGQAELTFSEISRKSGIPISTAHRILAGLVKGGLIARDELSGKYRIGPKIYALGNAYTSSTAAVRVADAVIKTLNRLINEDVAISALDRGNVIILAKEETRHGIRIGRKVGDSWPAYASALGKALLSKLSQSEIDRLYPTENLQSVTAKTISTKAQLRLELEEVRKSGVAFNREGGYEGVEGVGSVVLDRNGKAVVALGISVPIFRMDQVRREQLGTLVRLGARLISYRLGYQDNDKPTRDIREIIAWWEREGTTNK